MLTLTEVLSELEENVEADHQFRSQLRKIYKVILRRICQRKININVNMTWRNIKHLYGELVGDSSEIEYDKETVEEYGIHDAPSLAKIELSDIFNVEIFSDYELKFTVGEMYHGGTYYEPKKYISTSISKSQSEIMNKFFSEVEKENWGNKEKFKDVVYDYICEKFPEHQEIFLHELVHFFKNQLEEVEVRFQELIIKLENSFELSTIRERFNNFEPFKDWFFNEFSNHAGFGLRIDFDSISDKKRGKLVDKLRHYWNFKIK